MTTLFQMYFFICALQQWMDGWMDATGGITL
jgi:hypothetical protein